ncbi:MAG TPA: carboxymuconolactone decarboxylase family protein [Candidatus Tectomicrobia bacterium]|nr:carboxymuconolactone decarboxylase family protein [Candidatus Tectomicrobia bacterium]
MADDALWYEAAHVVGVTNALNVAADGLDGVLAPADETPAVRETFDAIRRFYALPAGATVPAPFRLVARDPGYLAELWEATRRAFEDNRLGRRLKEALAFAVSLTTRSAFGTGFHLGEMRRLGVSDAGVTEVIGVAQMFSSYSKIADTLQLESDMGDMAPEDPTPAPGGRPR